MVTLGKHRRTAAALWGGSALVLAGTGVGAALVLTGGSATAAPASSGSASTNGGNGQGNNGVGGGNGAGTGAPGKALVVSASASGRLAPGLDDQLDVRITNPNSTAVEVTKVSGSVTGVTELAAATGPARCTAAWYSLSEFTGQRRIEANSAGTVRLLVRFRNEPSVNQDRCKGATYRFAFSATAVQAARP